MSINKTIIKPEIVIWLRQRLGLSEEEFARRMQVSSETARKWEHGDMALTMNQAKHLSSLALVPFGMLFLDVPPHRRISIPDFRSVENVRAANFSPELEATVFEMREKQDWYKNILMDNGGGQLDFVGSITARTPVTEAVQKIHDVLQIPQGELDDCKTWEDYFDIIVHYMEEAGVTVIKNGVVGNNSHRPLDVEEFRGFVLTDKFAPLIFINGRDSKNAQMFTLLHEFVHILLGESGLVDVNMYDGSSNAVEKYCNKISAEFLVPQKALCENWRNMDTKECNLDTVIHSLAKKFRVSALVVIIRCKDLKLISSDCASEFWQIEMKKIAAARKQQGSGGNFYAALKYRIGVNFAKTIIAEVAEKNISYQDAFRLLHVKNTDTLIALSHEIGLPIL